MYAILNNTNALNSTCYFECGAIAPRQANANSKLFTAAMPKFSRFGIYGKRL